MEIRTNTMVIITPKMNFLQMPIVDKYYVPPHELGAAPRDPDFAAAEGFLNRRSS
jgi:hypothetical protein